MELAGLKTYGVVLEKEFENLNTVIMLSHFGLRVMDTGEPAMRGRPSPPPLASHILPPGPHWSVKLRPRNSCPFT